MYIWVVKRVQPNLGMTKHINIEFSGNDKGDDQLTKKAIFASYYYNNYLCYKYYYFYPFHDYNYYFCREYY